MRRPTLYTQHNCPSKAEGGLRKTSKLQNETSDYFICIYILNRQTYKHFNKVNKKEQNLRIRH